MGVNEQSPLNNEHERKSTYVSLITLTIEPRMIETLQAYNTIKIIIALGRLTLDEHVWNHSNSGYMFHAIVVENFLLLMSIPFFPQVITNLNCSLWVTRFSFYAIRP